MNYYQGQLDLIKELVAHIDERMDYYSKEMKDFRNDELLSELEELVARIQLRAFTIEQELKSNTSFDEEGD